MANILRLLVVTLAASTSCRGAGRDSPKIDTALVFIQTPPRPADSVSPRSPLTLEDFLVAGLKSGMDSEAVRRLLGAPDSTSADEDFRDPGAKLIAWYYHDIMVEFGSYNSLGGVEIIGPAIATLRGLRVGDPAERVRELYPTDCAGEDGQRCQLEYPGDSDGLTAILFTFAHGKVKSIYLGHLYD